MSKLPQDIKMIPCKSCGEDMPELRTTLYGYKFCVNCSTTKPKKAINAQFGEGDHTFNDIVFVED